ncbi:MAG: 30S ribosomal protein S6 [Myxococcota bacterium]
MPTYLRKYETVTLVDPDSGTEGWDKVLGRMRDAIDKTGGREVRLEDWGRRSLAYTLDRAGKSKANYLYLLYLGSNDTVQELERLMKITEPAMLWQTILLDDRTDADAFDFEAEGGQMTFMAKKVEVAREEEEERARREAEKAEAGEDSEEEE